MPLSAPTPMKRLPSRPLWLAGRWLFSLALALSLTLSAWGATPAYAATLTVTNANDSGAGSLRQAIADAASGDTIQFAGDYTITLASQLTINKNLTIDGGTHAITLDGNNAVRVFNVSSGTVTLNRLHITRGRAGYGGGIYLSGGTLTVNGSAFVTNSATTFGGGAISTDESTTLNVNNSTFSGNSAVSDGGAISAASTITLRNNTIVANSSGAGGGAVSLASSFDPSWFFTIRDSIVADNSPLNCSTETGETFVGAKNLSNDATNCGSTFTNSTSILLGTLGTTYGGSLPIYPLLPGSAAIDSANSCLTTDQRGSSRPTLKCDIGAFESQGFTFAVISGNNQTVLINTAFAPLRLSVTANNAAEPVNDGQVKFTAPASGASATPATNTVTIASGAVSQNLTANGLVGAYTVTASASGASDQGFSLANVQTPLVVTNEALTVTGNSAILNGFGTPRGTETTGWFRYATTSPGVCNDTFGTRIPTSGGTALGAGYSQVYYSETPSGLTPGTTYYYCAIAQNLAGTSFGTVKSLTTLAVAPTVTTSEASDVTTTGATLNGIVNANGSSTTVTFEYGLDTSYGTPVTAIQSPVTGSTDTSVSKAITGLLPFTTYHYRVIGNNAAGTIYGLDQSFTTSHLAGVQYVKPTASGAANCSGWADACELQTALTGAISGDEIWVAAGTYIPSASGDRTKTFKLVNGVAVYGGFAGDETQRSDRHGGASILSGDIGTSGDNTDNAYHVVTGVTGATLDGFTISGGNADGSSDRGGGMYNSSSSPTVTNVTFSGNFAKYGGGMYNYNSSPTLTNITFNNNSANSGGGMFNYSGSNPSLTNITFSNNSAGLGGGMFNTFSSSPALTTVTFSANTATISGGGMYNYSSSPTLINLTISGNSATSQGGGIFNAISSNPTLTNVTISGNAAAEGGGMANYECNPIIRNTIFWGNTAGTGAQIHNDVDSAPSVSDSIIAGGYTGGTNIIATDPLLGALGNYGGLTETLPLLPGSAAIDAGNDATCAATDQRGESRVDTCDIGAFESQGFTLGSLTGTPQSTVINTAFSDPLGLTVTAQNAADPVNGGQVTFTAPASGASLSITPIVATISGGAVSQNVSANDTAGSYNVTASANGASSVDFALTNLGIYTVTYAHNPAGGTGVLPTQADVATNDTFTVASGSGLTRTGYTFSGWSDGTTTYQPADTYTMGTENVTLTAHWTTNSYTVSFDAAGGLPVPSDQTVAYGALVSEPAEPTRSGYTFAGWYNGAVLWNFATDTLGAANLTLTAHWTTNSYTVSFDAAGGLPVPSDQTVAYGALVSEPAEPTRNGYTFAGWYNGAVLWNFATDTLGAANLTLTAQWDDTSAPDTQIDSAPANPTNNPNASFTFSSPESSAAFECALDAAPFAACTSPQDYTALPDGSHTFEVRAVDTALNADPTPASHAWLIDTAHLALTIEQDPAQPDPTNAAPILFQLTFSKPIDPDTLTTDDLTLGGTAPGTLAAVITEIAPHDATTFQVALSGMSATGTVTLALAEGKAQDTLGNPNTASFSADNEVTYDVDKLDVTTLDLDVKYTGKGPNGFAVIFNKPVSDPEGNTETDDVTNTANYLLFEKGSNHAADTLACKTGLVTDDRQIPVSSVTYDPATRQAEVSLFTELPVGSYRLLICGSTSIVDLAGSPLNNGVDYAFDLEVAKAPNALPQTGFPWGKVTLLPEQPAAQAYNSPGLTLDIPTLGIKTDILGVPQTNANWDVSWLNQSAGWLEGSAYPTWAGNTVLTGHVWDADNTPGIFANLKTLRYGDQFHIHAFGQTYTYEVRENRLIGTGKISQVFQHEEKDWVTLLTCEFYNPFTEDYLLRRIVRAVLISVR